MRLASLVALLLLLVLVQARVVAREDVEDDVVAQAEDVDELPQSQEDEEDVQEAQDLSPSDESSAASTAVEYVMAELVDGPAAAAAQPPQGLELKPGGSLPPCPPKDQADMRMCLMTFKNLGYDKFSKSKAKNYDEMCAAAFTTESGLRTQCVSFFNKYFANKLNDLKKLVKEKVPEVFCFDTIKAEHKGQMEDRCKQVTASGLPRCAFFHGVGEKNDVAKDVSVRYAHPGHVLRTFPDYWGKLDQQMNGICEPIFYWTETRKRGWNDMGLTREYCAAIDYFFPLVIFTHSMGNLIVANGFANELAGCKRLSKYDPLSTISWYGIQGPLRGAPGNILLQKYCKKFEKVSIVKKLLKRCIDGGGMEPAYASMVPTFRDPNSIGQLFCKYTDKNCKALLYIASTLQRGSMCGLSPRSGLKLTADIGLQVLAWKTHFEVKNDPDWDSSKMKYPEVGNDGMVSFTSCRNLGANGQPMVYLTSPEDNYYALKGNHGDGTCRFGEGKTDDLKPCTWIRNMAQNALNILNKAKADALIKAAKEKQEEKAREDAKKSNPAFRELADMHVLAPMIR